MSWEFGKNPGRKKERIPEKGTQEWEWAKEENPGLGEECSACKWLEMPEGCSSSIKGNKKAFGHCLNPYCGIKDQWRLAAHSACELFKEKKNEAKGN